MNVLRSLLIALVAVLAACVLAVFLFRVAVLPRIMAEDATGPVLAWRTLIPETALVAYAALDRAPDDADALQIAETSTEPALDGQTVSIAGFMVPLDATRGTTATRSRGAARRASPRRRAAPPSACAGTRRPPAAAVCGCPACSCQC